MSKTVTVPLVCQICKKAKPPNSGMIAELIRSSLLEFIKKKLPDLESKGFICLADLGEFRKDYIKEVLEDEIGELSALDQEVIESLEQHEILSSDIEKQFEKKTHFRRATLRPHCRVRRQLEISHYIWRSYLRLDRCERRVARYQSV